MSGWGGELYEHSVGVAANAQKTLFFACQRTSVKKAMADWTPAAPLEAKAQLNSLMALDVGGGGWQHLMQTADQPLQPGPPTHPP